MERRPRPATYSISRSDALGRRHPAAQRVSKYLNTRAIANTMTTYLAERTTRPPDGTRYLQAKSRHSNLADIPLTMPMTMPITQPEHRTDTRGLQVDRHSSTVDIEHHLCDDNFRMGLYSVRDGYVQSPDSRLAGRRSLRSDLARASPHVRRAPPSRSEAIFKIPGGGTERGLTRYTREPHEDDQEPDPGQLPTPTPSHPAPDVDSTTRSAPKPKIDSCHHM